MATTFTRPLSESTVTGETTLTVNVTDIGVSQVAFSVDGVNVFTDTESPYTYQLDTTQYPNGSHVIKATTTHTLGTNSDTIKVYTSNPDNYFWFLFLGFLLAVIAFVWLRKIILGK